MSIDKQKCPKCGLDHTVKNGKIHNEKRKFKCQSCERQFIENTTNKVIDDQTKELIDQLLLERIYESWYS